MICHRKIKSRGSYSSNPKFCPYLLHDLTLKNQIWRVCCSILPLFSDFCYMIWLPKIKSTNLINSFRPALFPLRSNICNSEPRRASLKINDWSPTLIEAKLNKRLQGINGRYDQNQPSTTDVTNIYLTIYDHFELMGRPYILILNSKFSKSFENFNCFAF